MRSIDADPATGSFSCEKASSTRSGCNRGFASRSAVECSTSRLCPPRRPTRTTTASMPCTGGAARRRAGVDPLPMFWSLLRESAPRAHLEAALARITGSSLRIAKTANLVRLGLGADERAAIELLRVQAADRGRVPAHERASQSTTRRLLIYLLLVTKQVDVICGWSMPVAAGAAAYRAPAAAGTSAPPRPLRSRHAPPCPVVRHGRRPGRCFPPGQVSRSKPPPGLAPELSERWAAIVDRARNIDRSDYFGMLDLARDATPEDANTSFLGARQEVASGPLPARALPRQRGVLARLRAHERGARDADGRRSKRARLHEAPGRRQRLAGDAGRTWPRSSRPRPTSRRPRSASSETTSSQAEELCRKALEGDPTQADYHAMLAWLISLKPENQAPAKVASRSRCSTRRSR